MLMGSITWTCLLLAGAPDADVWHMNQRSFQIPIRIQPKRKPDIRELRLYYSGDRGRSWHRRAQARPDQPFFSFVAPRDGEYWFKVQVVNADGKADPADITRGLTGQKIVVDTSKPQLRFARAAWQGDQVTVRWVVEEEHLDPATFRLEYRPTGATEARWTPLPVMPGPQGEETFRPETSGPLALRLVARDRAGNQSEIEATVVRSLEKGPAAPLPDTVARAMPPAEGAGGGPAMPPPPPPPPGLGEEDVPPRAAALRRMREGSPAGPVAPASLTTTGDPAGALPPVRIINKQQAKLDFNVTKVGPSGLGGVDVYVTADEGETWARSPIDPQATLPATADHSAPVNGSVTVTMPQEGKVYGFYIVVKSRAGLGQPPPRPGQPPQIRLEVDTTLPQADLYSPQADATRRDALNLTWSATDRNLAPNPITLEWAEQPDGPWQVIGEREMPNTGRYTWTVPEQMPPRAYLRLTVKDTAGNVALAQTDQPILIDLSIPQVENVGLSLGR
jgi:hypothetical protein